MVTRPPKSFPAYFGRQRFRLSRTGRRSRRILVVHIAHLGGIVKASRVLTVFVLTAGGMTVTAPAFANDGGSVTVCDTALASVQPGGCVSVAEWGPRVAQYTFISGGLCSGDTPLVPTVTEYCVYTEVDSPTHMVAQP
jgi:hypothetical protein